ncbi:GTPase EngB [Capsaspora owczarzaki ATCC 30864]|nr:GTPase EngB [Capsaspora owczarzaki ATCC 30864]|eukprot:XP_004349393.2 GTPase EngB [Capsaspora owczarzaki ATCC 30864]
MLRGATVLSGRAAAAAVMATVTTTRSKSSLIMSRMLNQEMKQLAEQRKHEERARLNELKQAKTTEMQMLIAEMQRPSPRAQSAQQSNAASALSAAAGASAPPATSSSGSVLAQQHEAETKVDMSSSTANANRSASSDGAGDDVTSTESAAAGAAASRGRGRRTRARLAAMKQSDETADHTADAPAGHRRPSLGIGADQYLKQLQEKEPPQARGRKGGRVDVNLDQNLSGDGERRLDLSNPADLKESIRRRIAQWQKPGNAYKPTEPDLQFANRLFQLPSQIVTSTSDIGLHSPPEKYPEFAVIGRSNVGKSSLINALVHSTTLVRTSATPGHTKTLNFFSIGRRIGVVDCPGYGYRAQEEWMDNLGTMLSTRSTIRQVLLLIDPMHGLKTTDLEVMQLLEELEKPFQIVFTKSDRMDGKLDMAVMRATEIIARQTTHCMPFPFPVSVLQNKGLGVLRHSILRALDVNKDNWRPQLERPSDLRAAARAEAAQPSSSDDDAPPATVAKAPPSGPLSGKAALKAEIVRLAQELKEIEQMAAELPETQLMSLREEKDQQRRELKAAQLGQNEDEDDEDEDGDDDDDDDDDDSDDDSDDDDDDDDMQASELADEMRAFDEWREQTQQSRNQSWARIMNEPAAKSPSGGRGRRR